jgi:hypothetical protein
MSTTKESLEKIEEKKQNALKIKQFKMEQKIFIMTSRFNTQTREENARFRKKNWGDGCVYCSPEQVSQKIPHQAKLLVLEMDNDKNQIFAIGQCANRPLTNKYGVYENKNYNRFNYVGKHRISRTDFNPMEEAVFKALDQLCFFGNDHMKRGHGLKAFPVKLIVNCNPIFNIPQFLDEMFSRRFLSSITQNYIKNSETKGRRI